MGLHCARLPCGKQGQRWLGSCLQPFSSARFRSDNVHSVASGRDELIGFTRKYRHKARPSKADAVLWNSLHADKLAAGHRQAAGSALNNGVVVRACKPLSMLLAQEVFSLRVLVKAEA